MRIGCRSSIGSMQVYRASQHLVGPEAVLIDRDGTINVDSHYPHKPSELRFEPDALTGLQFLARLNVPLIVISNQGGIAAGLFSEQQMHEFNEHLLFEIERAGGRIDAIYACPHLEPKFHPEGAFSCDCLKPKPGLLEEAAADFDLDLSRCVFVGDTTKDLAAANAAGCEAVLVLTGKVGRDEEQVDCQPDLVVGTLVELAGRLANRRSLTGSISQHFTDYEHGEGTLHRYRTPAQYHAAHQPLPRPKEVTMTDEQASRRAAQIALSVADYFTPSDNLEQRDAVVDALAALADGSSPTREQYAAVNKIYPYIWREWPASGADGGAVDAARAALDLRLTGHEALAEVRKHASRCLEKRAPERLSEVAEARVWAF